MSEEQYQNEYSIYTEEQMNGFVEDGIMHETILEIIHCRNTHALRDLIVYTDIYDPDILEDATRELSYEDKLWFITNRVVIITMYPDTYTNMLSNWRVSLHDTLCPQHLLMAFTELLDPYAPDYELVARVLLHVANFEEIIDILSELNPKNVLATNADGQLFEFMALMLDTKRELITNLQDGQLTNIVYTPILQSYLDVLGNYIRPYPYRTNPKIVTAYEAMRDYLQEQECEISVYIMLVNQFHEEDIKIFKDICDVLARFPPDITLTTEFGYGVFLECIRFDLSDELIALLGKYKIIPDTLNNDFTNYKTLAKIFYAATLPEPRLQIHEALHQAGYFKAYHEWFNNSGYEDLLAIDTCEWPLMAFFNNDNTPSHNPALELVNLKDYDCAALLMQFLWINDLTNPGEFQKQRADYLFSLLQSAQISFKLSDKAGMDIGCWEFDKYLRTRQFLNNPELVRNKLYQLDALTRANTMSQEVYKYLEQEVFATYIHQLISEKFGTAQLGQLLVEYHPDYTIRYWEALMKSCLKAKSPKFTTTIGLLKTTYFQNQSEDPTQLSLSPPQTLPEPNELIATLYDDINIDKLPFKCEPETLVAKFAIVLKEFYKSETINHCAILEELIELQLSRLKYQKQNYTSYIQLILAYSTKTDFEFKLCDVLIGKIRVELNKMEQMPIDNNTFSNSLTYLSIVLWKHTTIGTAKPLILDFLTNIFTTNESLLLTNTMELLLENTKITPELCYFMRDTLLDSEFCVQINTATTPGMMVIRPTGKEYQKIQNSRRRNWCASRQIQYGTRNLALLSDSDTQEFICPITFESQKVGDWIINLTACGHKFSSGGIMEWCRENTTCPVCRADLASGKLSGANCEMLELV